MIRKNNELYHHGIKGQKWGVRRYQNEDGSFTAKGKKRLNKNEKNALKIAGTMAGISIAQTTINYKNAQGLLDAMGGPKILMSEVVKKGTVAAGKAAVIGIIGYVGVKKASDFVKERRSEE